MSETLIVAEHLRGAVRDVTAELVTAAVRLGEPQDIANAVAFLASPVSSFTVGQNLHVDGGFMQHVAF